MNDSLCASARLAGQKGKASFRFLAREQVDSRGNGSRRLAYVHERGLSRLLARRARSRRLINLFRHGPRDSLISRDDGGVIFSPLLALRRIKRSTLVVAQGRRH